MPQQIEFFMKDSIIHELIENSGYNRPPKPGEFKGFVFKVEFTAGATPGTFTAKATVRDVLGIPPSATSPVPPVSGERDICPHPPPCRFTLTGDVTIDIDETNKFSNDCYQ